MVTGSGGLGGRSAVRGELERRAVIIAGVDVKYRSVRRRAQLASSWLGEGRDGGLGIE